MPPLRNAASISAVTGSWTATGALSTDRYASTTTRLQDGRVLVAGGYILDAAKNQVSQATAELYDPATGTWTYPRAIGVVEILETRYGFRCDEPTARGRGNIHFEEYW